MQALVEACRRQYSLVVVDLPAALPVLDVQAVAHLFDCFLLVAEWGRTSADLLGQAVRLDGVEEKLLGTLLTKVRLGALRRYQDRTTEMIPRKRFLSFGRIA
jgi:Mrp family chromosome partitioning ATPase